MAQNFKGITTIVFDADGTLWDFEGVMHHAMGIVLSRLEWRIPSILGHLSVDGMLALREEVAVELKKERGWTHEYIRFESFRRTMATVGIVDDTLAREMTDLYLKHRFEDIKLFDDVVPVLNVLQDRYTIGLLTNGNTEPDRCGLSGRFGFTVFSQEYGFEKPDPRLFEAAIQRAGCRRDQIVNVGDSLETDVDGAKRAGVAAIWLNRKGKRNNTGVEPDYEITSLTELLSIL